MSLASRFATKMVRRYGLLKNKKGKCCVNYEVSEGIEVIGRSNLFNVNLDEVDNSRKLCEMAYFLEVIRDIQGRVAAKSKKLVLEVLL